MTTVRVGEFEWDDGKARSNVQKHGISFEEAITVFLDELAVPFEEPKHPDRLVLIGESQLGRVVLVVFTERVGGDIFASSVRDALQNRNGEPIPTESEPSKRSLRDIPEVDFSRAKRLRRGKYAEKARRSFAIAIVDPKLFARFGSSEAINAAIRAVVDASNAVKRPGRAKRRSKRTAA